MITSTSNARIKEIVQFQKKRRARNQAGVFVAEGIRMMREIPSERLLQLYTTEAFYKKHQEELSGKKLPLEFVSPHVFEYISDTQTPQGILAIVQQQNITEESIFDSCNQSGSGQCAHLVILDNLQDPGNLGTIFRTAEAAGVTGILLSKDCVDLYNPKTIRSTMGAIFRMPFVYVEDIPEIIKKLKEQGVRIFAAHLNGKRMYDEEDYTGKTAFLIGNEGNGLCREAAECADTWVRIPMYGQAESLNAAVAASILMFEVNRQRRSR